MKLVMLLIGLIIGAAAGYWTRPLLDSDKTAGVTTVPEEKPGVAVKDSAAKFAPDETDMLVPIPLELADTLRKMYKKSYIQTQKVPRTECVVHEYDELKSYVDGLGAEFNRVSSNYKGYKKGIAIYFGAAFDNDFFYGSGRGRGHLFKNNLTAFLMPVHYTLKKLNTANSGDSTIDKFLSPLDTYRKDIQNTKTLASKINRQQQTEGYDLGHTHP